MFGDQRRKTRKNQPIHHANIKDQRKAIKRLRAAFRKIKIILELGELGPPIEAFVVLTEVGNMGVSLFSPKKLKKKTHVLFKLGAPLAISIRGVVRYCEQIRQESMLQSANKEETTYRTTIEFIFAGEQEKLAVADVYEKIRDENYVPTNWHAYITDRMQAGVGLKKAA